MWVLEILAGAAIVSGSSGGVLWMLRLASIKHHNRRAAMVREEYRREVHDRDWHRRQETRPKPGALGMQVLGAEALKNEELWHPGITAWIAGDGRAIADAAVAKENERNADLPDWSRALHAIALAYEGVEWDRRFAEMDPDRTDDAEPKEIEAHAEQVFTGDQVREAIAQMRDRAWRDRTPLLNETHSDFTNLARQYAERVPNPRSREAESFDLYGDEGFLSRWDQIGFAAVEEFKRRQRKTEREAIMKVLNSRSWTSREHDYLLKRLTEIDRFDAG